MIQYVVDFDDLCDQVMTQEGRDLMDFLLKWKAQVPGLKLTFFAIPNRCSPATIAAFTPHREWIALAPHGWEHTRGECLGWTQEEAREKILAAKEMGIDAPVFRAPGWLLDGEIYEACRELGYTVASHETYRISKTGVPEYVYNLHHGASPARVRRIHGHLTPVSGNWIYDMWDAHQLSFPTKSTFSFPWEVSTVIA